MTRKFSILFLAVCGLLAQTAENVVGGPYVVNVTPKSATVAWVVQGPEARLETGLGKLARPAATLRVEKLAMKGLAPGTVYHYEAFEGAEGKGHFRTPPTGAVPFRFMVYGDTRTRHDVHAKVIAAMLKAPDPDFIVHTGDLVADGSVSAQWPVFFSIERELLRKTAFFPVIGNHERNNQRYYEFFELKTPYYSFDWANAHVVVMNTDLGNVTQNRDTYWNEELRWLEDDLAKSSKADFVFVVTHHPPFTAVKRRQVDDPELNRIPPLMEKYKVSAVFSGHDHNYQHHLKNGVRYIVTGGGGAPLYPVDGPLEGVTQKVESVEHFVGVEVDGKAAKIQAFALDGQVMDSIALASRAGRL